MINKEEAEALAISKIKEIEARSRIKLAILKDKTKTFEYGWMFFYQSEEYVRTGNLGSLLGGNSPIIVDKLNNNVLITGTGKESNYYIKMYCELRDDLIEFKKVISQ